MKNKKAQIVLVNDIEHKDCTRCRIVLPLESYRNHKKGLGGKYNLCPSCDLNDKQTNDKTVGERKKRWVEANPEKNRQMKKALKNKRRAHEKALPSDFNGKQWTEIVDRFDGTCAISDSKNFVLEHVIPIAWGRGGTHINNVVPMDASLNGSKGKKNIFEWIQRPDIQARVDMEKFEDMIERLAFLNDMSSIQYKEHVYWCEANKRTIDEIKGGIK